LVVETNFYKFDVVKMTEEVGRVINFLI